MGLRGGVEWSGFGWGLGGVVSGVGCGMLTVVGVCGF